MTREPLDHIQARIDLARVAGNGSDMQIHVDDLQELLNAAKKDSETRTAPDASLDLEDLLEKAERAEDVLPEPWIIMGYEHDICVVQQSQRDGSITGGGLIAQVDNDAFREHILAFQPKTAIAMAQELKMARRQLVALSVARVDYDEHCSGGYLVKDIEAVLDRTFDED